MSPAKSSLTTGAAAEKQLAGCVAKFAAPDQQRIRAVRRALRQRLG